MKDIANIQNEIIENFGLFEEWEDKYEYLLEFSNAAELVDEAEKIDINLVKGCQSRVWLLSECVDGKVLFRSDGDSPIPKGIAAALVKILSRHSPEEVVKADVNFHKETRLINYLSPARVRGVESMILKFKSLASEYLIKH
ncbi:SufE family protein [Reichenbachiella sp.]|uniref:SufE family protein n=1 Tax=Reichenbachiella sp. TaxID=2184521 RepID=UPI0032983A0C